MTAALTPATALGYLRELSADIRAAVLLDGDGGYAAGDERLAAPARAAFAGIPPGPAQWHGATGAGGAFAARDERHQLVAVTGPRALPGLTAHDLAGVLRALGGGGPESGRGTLPPDAVEALLNAAAGSR
jgi:hypothetical protein